MARLDDLNDILALIKDIEELRAYEERTKYTTLPSFKSTIKLMDKQVREAIRSYEQDWGRKLPIGYLKRYVRA